jgi:hypothetical protein
MSPTPDVVVPELVTLAGAKEHLKIRDSDHDSDVEAKRSAACAIVFWHLKAQADPAWTADTVPGDVKSAILVLLSFLYQERGDAVQETSAGDVWTCIDRLLARRRDPALA